MSGFGERLERERLQRGVQLEDISVVTKISTRMLRALEKEDFAKLPGGVFNRGFVRSYARYLGLDEEQAVAEYLAAAGDVEQPAAPRISEPGEAGRWLRFFFVASVVIVAVVALWMFRHSLHSGWQRLMAHRPSPIQTVSANAKPASKPAVPPAPTDTTSSSQTSVASQSGDSSAAQPAESATSQAQSTNPQPTPSSAAPNAAAPPSPNSAAQQGQFVVAVRATKDAWVSATADGNKLMQGTLKSGEERRFTADQKLVLVTGNAGGMEITFNGNSVGAVGGDGEAKKLTFTPSGLQRQP